MLIVFSSTQAACCDEPISSIILHFSLWNPLLTHFLRWDYLLQLQPYQYQWLDVLVDYSPS